MQFHEERTRFCVLLCHRRFGKTVASINDLIRQAMRSGKSDWRAAYMAPFLGQAKTVAWDYLRHFTHTLPDVKYNISELSCTLPTGARIRLFGTDNAHALRGMYLDDLVLDEPADMPREVWTQVLRPMLADRKGRALFCGTPKGVNNLLHDAWEEAGKGTQDWCRFMFRASDTGYVDADELVAAKNAMGSDEYAQEFECSFSAALKGAFYASILEDIEKRGQICAVPYSPELPVHTAWDLGIDDATAIWFFQITRAGQWRVLDYLEDSGEGLQHYVSLLNARGYIYGTHIAPHDIKVRELGTGMSRLETAKQLGINFVVAPNLSLADGIGAVRQALPRMCFDAEKCAGGLTSLRAYRKKWRSKEEIYAQTPLHDWTSHGADAMRYAVVGMREERLDMSPGKSRAKTSYDIWS